ncbi:MAG: ABC transporter permease [Fibrobacteria bacterium]|nr:ABC transporter permease [Fibrobacteria bacterium]
MKPSGHRRGASLFRIQGTLAPRPRAILWVLSFLVPLLAWSAVSYVPWIWHPLVEVSEPGDVRWFTPGMRVDEQAFDRANALVAKNAGTLAVGTPANPVFLPAPHEVARALFTSFATPPRLSEEMWLHESLLHSMRTIALGFLISSLIGIPLGIACGAIPAMARLSEPFLEFFRYLPAPAFGALCVAVLGINDAPKIAIIFIGTFFQQVLVVANTVRRVEPSLIEAAQTLGAPPRHQLLRVVVPASIADLYTDQRVLLGWAWTYLVVAELIGTSSGITYFINLQAKYRAYDNVMAAILIIGVVGLGSDLVLAWIGRRLFPWRKDAKPGLGALFRRRSGKPVVLEGAA